jgi:hypothetical protein
MGAADAPVETEMGGTTMRALAKSVEHRSPSSPVVGPAVVVAREDDGAVRVTRPDGSEVRAEMALALPYEACKGDVLLVIGGGDGWYVIGVLSGKGKTDLSFPGDVTLRSLGGRVEIAGDEGVHLRGREVELHAGVLRVVAETAIETVSTLVQRVADAITTYARSSHTLVEEDAYTQAKTAAFRTEETLSINGKQIHLG